MQQILSRFYDEFAFEYKLKSLDKLFHKNINNYVYQKKDEIKVVGHLLQVGINSATFRIYNEFMCGKKAVIDFFFNGENYKTSILRNENTEDFLFYRNVGSTYEDVKQNNRSLPHHLRLYSSIHTHSMIYKIKNDREELIADLPDNPVMVYSLKDLSLQDINKNYYIERVEKLIHDYTERKYTMYKYVPFGKNSKIPIKGFDFNAPLTYEEVTEYDDYGVLIPESVVLIDIDDKILGEKVIQILDHLSIPSTIMETPNGYHFYFLKNKTYHNSNKIKTPLGIPIDVKCGGRKGYAKIYGKNDDRHFLHGRTVDDMFDNLVELPFFLEPLRTKSFIDVLAIDKGERNDSLFRYINTLIYHGINDPSQIKLVLHLINSYILKEPLPTREINSLCEEGRITNRIIELNNKIRKNKVYLKTSNPNENKTSYSLIAQDVLKKFDIIEDESDLYIVDPYDEILPAKMVINWYLYMKHPYLLNQDKKEILSLVWLLFSMRKHLKEPNQNLNSYFQKF